MSKRSSSLADGLFVLGIAGKGLNGVVELVGGILLLVLGPQGILGVAQSLTAPELAEEPNSFIANAVLHGAQHLGAAGTVTAALYLLVHGLVKVIIVIFMLRGSTRIYPWAVGVLIAFLALQLWQLATGPSLGIALLTVLDAVILALTWREWRHGTSLQQAWESARAGLGGRRRAAVTADVEH